MVPKRQGATSSGELTPSEHPSTRERLELMGKYPSFLVHEPYLTPQPPASNVPRGRKQVNPRMRKYAVCQVRPG